MPNRIIRPGINRSKKVDALSWAEEVFYRRLFAVADDYGVFELDFDLLVSDLYPLKRGRVSAADVAKWWHACANAALVSQYEVQGRRYGVILNFGQRTRSSMFPPPPAGSGIVLDQTGDGECGKFYRLHHPADTCQHVSADDGLGEGEGVGEKYLSLREHAREEESFPGESNALGELYQKWLQWLEVRDFTHGNGKPIHPLVRSRQLQTLISLPEDVREAALDAAIKGCWKNIQDIRESASGGKTNGRKRVDPRDPATWE